MRFVDEAVIQVSAGHGGKGCIAFRRETYEPRGGPNGGDGGRGGSVIFEASNNFSTLQDFRYKREYKAPEGRPGGGSDKSGRAGDDIIVYVPVGTLIYDQNTGELLVDLKDNHQQWLCCKGGRGGKGNAHFATAAFQAPKFAQPGEAGEFKSLRLELKLLADVGIIGYPNAGKSTLISKISAAKPKIADYAFTTLTPNLGVVSYGYNKNLVVADMPGLIEGAHLGLGKGHKFLKHIERTRLFIHLLDGAQLLEKVTNPKEKKEFDIAIEEFIDCYLSIRKELELYDEKLVHKPEVVVLNKIDVLSEELVEKTRKALRERLQSIRGAPPYPLEPYCISGVTGAGIPELLAFLGKEMFSPEMLTPEKIALQQITLPDGTVFTKNKAALASNQPTAF